MNTQSNNSEKMTLKDAQERVETRQNGVLLGEFDFNRVFEILQRNL